MKARQVALDTETTGLSPEQGHRLIEVGAVELINRRLTGRTFHTYINPERVVDEGAIAVHGIKNSFLEDKPLFAHIARDLITFLEGAELIIHNAPFDLGFLNRELSAFNSRLPRMQETYSVIDTLVLARKKHPRQANNLDALCQRYNVDNSKRDVHGALVDAKLLAQVFLAMTGGQTTILFNEMEATMAENSEKSERIERGALRHKAGLVRRASARELEAHAEYLEFLKGKVK